MGLSEISEIRWGKSVQSLRAAMMLPDIDPDSSVSRAFCAASHAVSALLLFDGKSFRETPTEQLNFLHSEYIKVGSLTPDAEKNFRFLWVLNEISVHGWEPVKKADAEEALKAAHAVIESVHQLKPHAFIFEKNHR